jgi:hypothetical protein
MPTRPPISFGRSGTVASIGQRSSPSRPSIAFDARGGRTFAFSSPFSRGRGRTKEPLTQSQTTFRRPPVVGRPAVGDNDDLDLNYRPTEGLFNAGSVSDWLVPENSPGAGGRHLPRTRFGGHRAWCGFACTTPRNRNLDTRPRRTTEGLIASRDPVTCVSVHFGPPWISVVLRDP